MKTNLKVTHAMSMNLKTTDAENQLKIGKATHAVKAQ